jgi:hypothetical protein
MFGQAKCSFRTFSAPSGYTLLDVGGVSNSGTVVGGFESNSTLHEMAFARDTAGHFSTYKAPGSSTTHFTGINDAGIEIGTYQDNAGHFHGFTLSGSHFTAVNDPGAINTFLEGINKAGVMVGQAITSSASEGFEVKAGQYSALQFPGALNTEAAGINSVGTIVGEYDFDGAFLHGFILQNGNYQSVDDPSPNNAFGTRLLDVNSSGTVVGEYEDSDAFFHGFIYKNGVFQDVDYPGSRNTFVNAINNAELVAGVAYFDQGSNLGYVANCQ